jgi:NADH dehydrogenase [ubiquinone] 1 alpha subcomplex assembly factor 7
LSAAPLAEKLARRIAAAGPITVADYIAAAMTDPDHGYYRTAEAIGAAGDFTTAPEISQLFGELIGAWLADCWLRLGRPNPVRVIELGPGRGTLMQDALRASTRLPGWAEAVELHLVEINPLLRQAQAERLAPYIPRWHDTLDTVPDGPSLLVANEFLDALPIRQLVYWENAWRERLVDWSAETGFHFVLSHRPSPLAILIPVPAIAGAVFEISPAAIGVAAEIAGRIARYGGGALLIDYGRAESAAGESLQAVRRHALVPALENPGAADLSAHVDFAALARTAREHGTAVFGAITQGEFLGAVGIHLRAGRLKAAAAADQAAAIDAAVARLTGAAGMGDLFKVLAITQPGLIPAGFGTD